MRLLSGVFKELKLLRQISNLWENKLSLKCFNQPKLIEMFHECKQLGIATVMQLFAHLLRDLQVVFLNAHIDHV